MALDSKALLPPPRLAPQRPQSTNGGRALRHPGSAPHRAPLPPSAKITPERLLELRRLLASRHARRGSWRTLGPVFDALEETPLSIIGAFHLTNDAERG